MIFVSDNYKKGALRGIDHCTWYLSTSRRPSNQSARSGYSSYWRTINARRCSQLWSRFYIREWWQMLVLEGKFQKRSVFQIVLSKIMYWPQRSSRTFDQQCSISKVTRWRWPIQGCILKSDGQDYTDTRERYAIFDDVHWLPTLLKRSIK